MGSDELDSVEEVLLNHRSKLLNFIKKRVYDPDLAEDILQEGLLKALQSAGDLRDDERLIPWFYQILNHAVIDTYRRKNVEKRYLEAYLREMEMEGDNEARDAICECFRELLPSLKPEYAELIETIELEDGDIEQIAGRLQINRNNLKVRRHRARQALKQRIEETCRTCAVHGCLDCTCEANLSRKSLPQT